MSNYRQSSKARKVENTVGVRKKWIHALAAMLFCMVLCIGTVVFADEVPATVIVAGAKIRTTADTSSEALAGVKSGDTLSICGQTTGTDGNVWYQVYVDANTKGFIRSDLIQKKTDGNISNVPNQNANANTNTNTVTDTNTTTATKLEETQATAVEKKNATVVQKGVRIRKGASTQHDVVATANRGMVLTITGEAAGSDGKTWYQVAFSYNNKEITGFIRSDLVTFDSVPADTAVSEITGTEQKPEEPVTEVPAEPMTEEQQQEQQEPQQEPQPQPEDENANMILMNVDKEVYVLPEFDPIILKWQDQDINAFKNGKFYIFYAQKQNGEMGWFLYDSEKGVYQRYVYDTVDAEIPKDNALSGSTLPVIILVVVIVILLVVIALMFLKLREYTSDYYDEEYDEEDEEYEAEEELEELEEEELEEEEVEEEEPVQKPMKRLERPLPSTRTQPNGGQQVPRRPQQGGNGQMPRRPQQEAGEGMRRPQQGGNGQMPRRPQQGGNGQVPRRPQQEAGEGMRRPQQGGNGQMPRRPQQGEQPKRPIAQQNRPVKGNAQLQNGRRAKSFLDAEDDDMEFIDI